MAYSSFKDLPYFMFMNTCHLCNKNIDEDIDEELHNFISLDLEYKNSSQMKTSNHLLLVYCQNCFDYAIMKAEYLINVLENDIKKSSEQKESNKKNKKKK